MRDTLYVIEYLADWASDWKVYTCKRNREEALEAYARHIGLHVKEECRLRVYEGADNGDIYYFNPNKTEEDE
jgi:hypothetical protein